MARTRRACLAWPGLAAAAMILQVAIVSAAQDSLISRFNPVDQKTYKGRFEPVDIDYWSSAAFTGVIGGCLVVACALGTVLFILVRCGCLCCGPGFCPQPVETTGPAGRAVIKIAVALLSLGAIAGAVVSLIGTQKVTAALSHLIKVTVIEKGLDTVVIYLHTIQNMTDDAVAAAGSYAASGAPGAGSGQPGSLDLRGMQRTVEDLTSQVESITGSVMIYVNQYLDKVVSGALIASIVILVLIILLVLMGVIGALLQKRGLLACPMCSVPLWLVACWLLYTIFFVAHTIMGDVCSDIKGTALYCQDSGNPACRDYFIGGTLQDALASIHVEETRQKLTDGVNSLIANANSDLEKLYAESCRSIADAKAQTPLASVVPTPKFCSDPNSAELLCPPFTVDGRVDRTCGVSPDSRYTRLANFASGFAHLRCAQVPDMQVAVQEAMQRAKQDKVVPTGPVVTCAMESRYVGSVMFDFLAEKAQAAGVIFDNFDVVLSLLKLQPLWDVLGSLANHDCPAVIDALFFLYLAECVLGSFLMALSVSWLVSWQRLSGVNKVLSIEEPAVAGLADPAGWQGKGGAAIHNQSGLMFSSQAAPTAPPIQQSY